MKNVLPLMLALALLLPGLLAAKVVVVPYQPEHSERALKQPVPDRMVLKRDEPSSTLLLPFFRVDTESAAGTTTLFAVRNISETDADVQYQYFDIFGNVLLEESQPLAAGVTRSVNIRDLGLTESQGFAAVNASVSANLEFEKGVIPPAGMIGDFFQVDVGGAFATGERMISANDTCEEQQIRFLDFGSSTLLQIYANNPQGPDPNVDPPSLILTIVDEAGFQDARLSIFTDQFVADVSVNLFSALSFGTLIFDFAPSDGGWVYAEYSADGLFSVGVNSSCTQEEVEGGPAQ